MTKRLPTSVPDAQIAAIARVRGFAVATRNIKDFGHCGVKLMNPLDAMARAEAGELPEKQA